MYSIRKIFVLLFFFPSVILCQDTTFINKHIFETPVRNVFKAQEAIFVKTGDGLFKLEGSKWVLKEDKFAKPFVFYDKGFYETVFLPNQYSFDAREMKHLIPQRAITNSTIAQIDDRLFLSTSGSLFEYSISSYFEHFYDDCSIRDIYIEDGLKVISTYSGIFINDSVRAKDPAYSSGKFCKVRGKYYLCNDELYAFNFPDNFRLITSAVNEDLGNIRKLIEYRDTVYSLNTKSINRLDENYNQSTIHQGFVYYDLEKVKDVLIFGTHTGEVFQYDGIETSLLINLKTKIRGIDIINDTVFLSTNLGVYTIENMQPFTLKLFADLPFCVKVVTDSGNNLWISTENGLYALPPGEDKPILFIPTVEFNSGALYYYKNNIYAGSIQGLFVVDVIGARRFFSLQQLNTHNKERVTLINWLILLVFIIAISAVGIFYYNKRKKKEEALIFSSRKPQVVLTLDMIEKEIVEHNIMSVEALAAHYNTNTVQLNRQFKSFDITPGKFIKKVKIQVARDLLKSGVSMEEVVNRVGYSARYIETELNP